MESQLRKNKFIESLRLPTQMIMVLWGIHILQVQFDYHLGFLGINPSKFSGLKGIITAPLVHGDWAHLVNNSIPLFVLSTMIMFFYRKVAIRSFILIYLLTGISVWLLAAPREVYHIGASGVVYGLVTFVLGSGIFRRNGKSIILALVVLFFYSGMFVGVLPNQEGISWESHLYGAFVGIFAAYFFKEEIEPDEEEKIYSYEKEEEIVGAYFLDRDVFEKTKAERQQEMLERRRQAAIEAQRKIDEAKNREQDGWTASSTFDEID